MRGKDKIEYSVAVFMIHIMGDLILKSRVDDSPYAMQLLISAALAASKSPRKELIYKPAYHTEVTTDLSADDIISVISKGSEHTLPPVVYGFVQWLFDTCARFEVNATEMKVKNIAVTEYNIVQPAEVNATFDADSSKETNFLYHGSPLENWFSILMNGLKNASDTALMTTGAAYGAGIYMSSDSNVSYGYGLSKLKGYGGISYLGIFEVHNVARWCKGNSIYVIEDERAVICRSILAVESPIDNEIMMTKIRMDKSTRLSSKSKLSAIRPRRLAKEIEMLKELSFDVSCTDDKYGSVIMRLQSSEGCSACILLFAEYPSGGILVLYGGDKEAKTKRLPAVMAKKIAERIDELIFENVTREVTFDDFIKGIK